MSVLSGPSRSGHRQPLDPPTIFRATSGPIAATEKRGSIAERRSRQLDPGPIAGRRKGAGRHCVWRATTGRVACGKRDGVAHTGNDSNPIGIDARGNPLARDFRVGKAIRRLDRPRPRLGPHAFLAGSNHTVAERRLTRTVEVSDLVGNVEPCALRGHYVRHCARYPRSTASSINSWTNSRRRPAPANARSLSARTCAATTPFSRHTRPSP